MDTGCILPDRQGGGRGDLLVGEPAGQTVSDRREYGRNHPAENEGCGYSRSHRGYQNAAGKA